MIKVYYKYRAIDDSGRFVDGILKSQSKGDVRDILIEKNLIPIDINIEIILKKNIDKKDLYVYCQKFSSLLKSGIDISTIMEILDDESENYLLKIGSNEIREKIHKGESLSKSVEDTNVFPKILVNMIRVGEETGELDLVFYNMSVYFYNQHKVENKFKNASIYPTVLISLTLLITIFLLIFIVPKFEDIFLANEINLPIITRIVLKLSETIRRSPIIFIIIPLVIFIIIKLLKIKNIKVYYDEFKLKKSILKKFNKKKLSLEILTPLSIMYKSGIPIIDIFENIKYMSDNSFIICKLEDIIDCIEKGGSISQAFTESDIFTKMINTSISVGEETGSLDSILVDLNKFYEDDMMNILDRFILFLEPLLIIIIGLLVGSITIALVLPILNLMDNFI